MVFEVLITEGSRTGVYAFLDRCTAKFVTQEQTCVFSPLSLSYKVYSTHVHMSNEPGGDSVATMQHPHDFLSPATLDSKTVSSFRKVSTTPHAPRNAVRAMHSTSQHWLGDFAISWRPSKTRTHDRSLFHSLTGPCSRRLDDISK